MNVFQSFVHIETIDVNGLDLLGNGNYDTVVPLKRVQFQIVRIGWKDVKTDLDGRFRVAGLPKGPVHVTVAPKNAISVEKTVDLPAHGLAGLTLRLTSGLTISGKVMEADGKPPVRLDVNLSGRVTVGSRRRSVYKSTRLDEGSCCRSNLNLLPK